MTKLEAINLLSNLADSEMEKATFERTKNNVIKRIFGVASINAGILHLTERNPAYHISLVANDKTDVEILEIYRSRYEREENAEYVAALDMAIVAIKKAVAKADW